MSGLSKAFVGILIVLSLLLSSAVIVWVNKTENWRAVAERSSTDLAEAKKGKEAAEAEAAAAKEARTAAIRIFDQQVATLQNDIKAKEQEISKGQIQIADLNSQLKQQMITLTSTGEALKASEAQKKLQADQIAQLRQSADKLLKEKSELNTALSDATNRLDVITREWRFLKEQLTETQSSADKLTRQVKDLGGDPSVTVGGVRAGAPAINGVVRDVRLLDDNRQWATISVGAADQVQKGMEFKVIDRQSGSFLGFLTVQNVQPNEAVGVLTGPRIDQIKAGSEVRTQL